MVICLERGAYLHMSQLMPLPLTVSCFSEIQIVLPFWYRPTRVVPEKGPLNGCVCVWSVYIGKSEQHSANRTRHLHVQHVAQKSDDIVKFGITQSKWTNTDDYWYVEPWKHFRQTIMDTSAIPDLKTVTALPCEMQTSFIWSKYDLHRQAKHIDGTVTSVTFNKLFSWLQGK